MNVLISGGSGLIGSRLTRLLQQKGYTVSHLSRKAEGSGTVRRYRWDVEKGEIDATAVEPADYIIHLAGENIGGRRWTEEQKRKIIDSRVKSAALLFQAVERSPRRPRAFISASAIGYYGAVTTDLQFVEDDIPGSDFLARVCKQWEQAADKFSGLGIRTVKIRTSVVLAPDAPALKKMAVPVRLGLGAPLGSGQQYFPCIHIDDLCGIYLKAIEDQTMSGAINAAMPEQKTNADYMRTMARVLGKPFFMPAVPSFVIKALFGEMAVAMLRGSRVSVNKLLSRGFRFKFERVEEALRDALHK